ncbi:impB/mucB/samB family protein [Botrytis cinerea]
MASETTPERDENEHKSLKYSLLGPSLTKSGQDSVDQSKVSEIIYNASKGSKYFNHEEERDKTLTVKIERILGKKAELEKLDLAHDRRRADTAIAELELTRDLTQTIVHIDCDAFYAAVEELDRPELKNVPFSVGKGVVTTCNYHARRFGVRSAMAGFIAKKLCPQLIQVPLNFDKYTAKAQEVREILVDYDPRFESASIDEAYLNITEYCQKNDIDPEAAVEQLRREVHEKTKVTISAGIAANAKIAKICSNYNKPNGQYRVANNRVEIMKFMRDLPTRKVNGIGRVFERELGAIGVKTCGDIYNVRHYLPKLFGEKAFIFLMQCYLGLGRTDVKPAEEYTRKSVGTEGTFNDINDATELRSKLRHTAEELEKDLQRTQQAAPPKAVFSADDLYKYSLPMLEKLEAEMPGLTLRLMGLRCTNLISMKKPDAMAFFGFRKQDSRENDVGENERTSSSTIKRKASDLQDNDSEERWEVWPEELLFEDAERQEREDEFKEMESLSQLEENDPRRHHGKEIVPNPKPKDGAVVKEEWWDCPVCQRPQATNEKEFNEHIDLCLSRQTIRDAVQETSGFKETKAGERSKDKGNTPSDPKQRKLCF